MRLTPLALFAIACGSDPEPAPTETDEPTEVPTGATGDTGDPLPDVTGSLQVTTVTDGTRIDPDGYTLDLGDGVGSRPLDANGSLRIDELPLGTLTATIADVAANCDVSAGSERQVEIAADAPSTLEVEVACVPAVDTDTLTYVAFDQDFGGYNPKSLAVSTGSDGVLFTETDVYRNTGPALSPDGRHVALSITDEQGVDRLWVMRVDGTEAVEIDAPAVHPTWSPDGTRLAYMYEDESFWRLRVRDARARTEPFTVTSQSWAAHPQWSPLGDEIAWVSRSAIIQAVTPDGQDDRIILDAGPDVYLLSQLAWSPDGSAIAYSRSDPGEDDYDVHVVSADGKTDLELFDSDRYDEFPVWSPDGTGVAFVHRVFTNVVEIWLAPADAKADPVVLFTEEGYTTIHGQGWGRVALP